MALFDEKELDKQIARTKKKNPFSLLQLPKAEKEKKKEEVKKRETIFRISRMNFE